MSDPHAADVRTVLRAEANRRRAGGAKVSVSHSGDFGVLVVSNSVEALGVDVEPRAGGIPEPALVRAVTSPAEFAAWAVLPESARRAAFVRLWTLKESALKARGAGLSGGMAGVRLRPDSSGVDEPGWFSAFVSPDSEHAVALAWRGGPAAIRVESIALAALF